MPIQALLFDLGGVVVDVDTTRCCAHWAPHSALPLDQLQARFGVDEAWCAHETGGLDTAGFLAHLRTQLALPQDDALALDGWNAMLLGAIAPTATLLTALQRRLPCHVLSNTNAAHVAAIRQRMPGLLDGFAQVFTSHEIGWRKPHPQSFLHVLQALDLPAQDILFFDDLPANIAAARDLGFRVVQVKGPEDVRRGVVEAGLLEG